MRSGVIVLFEPSIDCDLSLPCCGEPLGSKTFETMKTRQVREMKSCTHLDVAQDIYMPNNPELAKCPRVGARYPVFRRVTERVQKSCPNLPETCASWTVSQLQQKKWRLGTGGSSWVVTQISGGSQTNGVIRVASFAFQIEANQPC